MECNTTHTTRYVVTGCPSISGDQISEEDITRGLRRAPSVIESDAEKCGCWAGAEPGIQ